MDTDEGIGGGVGWGAGMPPLGGSGAAPGFSNPPSRTGTIPNFAQAIGGGASAQAPLDLSYVHARIPQSIDRTELGKLQVKAVLQRSRSEWQTPTRAGRHDLGSDTDCANIFANTC